MLYHTRHMTERAPRSGGYDRCHVSYSTGGKWVRMLVGAPNPQPLGSDAQCRSAQAWAKEEGYRHKAYKVRSMTGADHHMLWRRR